MSQRQRQLLIIRRSVGRSTNSVVGVSCISNLHHFHFSDVKVWDLRKTYTGLKAAPVPKDTFLYKKTSGRSFGSDTCHVVLCCLLNIHVRGVIWVLTILLLCHVLV